MMEIKKGKCKHCGDIFTLPESGKMVCVICDVTRKNKRRISRQEK